MERYCTVYHIDGEVVRRPSTCRITRLRPCRFEAPPYIDQRTIFFKQ